MRQVDVTFSSILTKIGDGEPLLPEEKALIESRFFTKEYVKDHYPESIRLFFRTLDVDAYNAASICGEGVIDYVSQDEYVGARNSDQAKHAREKVHKMKPNDTGGLPYMLRLLIGKPYMIRANIDVLDGLVNGAIGILRYVERDENGILKRLWLSFGDAHIGRLLRARCRAHFLANPDLRSEWIPISPRTATIQLKSKILSCKRTQFPLVEACAITIHKSQGGTYKTVVYEYDRSHEQQLVYVAMSRATSLEGLLITNKARDHTFYHSRGKENRDLLNEFRRLENHKLETIGDISRRFVAQSNLYPTALSLCTFNVQSLRAHSEDIASDFVLPTCKIMALSEIWIENDEHVDIPGFHPVSQFKRNRVRAGGVCIYEKEESSISLHSTEHELLKFDIYEMKVKRISTAHDGVGDICAIQTTINDKKALLVSVYITPGTTIQQLKQFLTLNLMAYSPKLGLFEELNEFELNTIPIIIVGDFNIDLKSTDGAQLLEFMQETFHLQLNNDPSIATTRNGTCIDAVFARHVEHLETRNYISYFSYHKPLLSITDVESTPV